MSRGVGEYVLKERVRDYPILCQWVQLNVEQC